MLCLYHPLIEVILDVESVDINMLHPIMIHWVMSYAYGRLIITFDNNWSYIGDLQLVEEIFNPHYFVNSL